eukprot:s149_g5.t1
MPGTRSATPQQPMPSWRSNHRFGGGKSDVLAPSMCYFLNLGLAVKATAAVWLVAIISLAIFKVSILCGQEYLFPIITELPLLVFFLFFFFGQHLCGQLWAPSFWLDKLCIHQTKEELKAQQVAALPVFVARSSRMLVLWDDTYFERLWCNMEMATFAKYSESPEKMEFLPLWLAPWLLSSMLLDLLGVTLLRITETFLQSEDNVKQIIKYAEMLFGETYEVNVFFHSFLEVFPNFLCYLPVALPTMFSFRSKIQAHKLMLEQMAKFELRNAKCSVEADRPLVEEQVALHFQPDLDTEVIVAGNSVNAEQDKEPGALRAESLERFNNYVQGPLRAAVLDCIGDTHDVPLYLCYLCFLPMTTYNAVTVSPVAFRECFTSVSTFGFAGRLDMCICFGLAFVLAQLLAYPVTFPVLLHLLHKVEMVSEAFSIKLLLGVIASCFAYAYSFFCAGVIWGATFVVWQRFTPLRLAAYLLVNAFLALQLWFFFGPRRQSAFGRCRCVEYKGGEDSKPFLALHCYDGA